MPQILLSMLLAIGSLVGLSALWVSVLSYGIRPNVGALGMGQLMSLIALPPLGAWGATTAAFVWRKRNAERRAEARVADERAAAARQAAAEAQAQRQALQLRQRPFWVRAAAVVERAPSTAGGIAASDWTSRCVALAQAAWDEVREQAPASAPDALLIHAPQVCHAALKKIAPGMEVVCFTQAADLLQNAFDRLDAGPNTALIALAVDSPLALLELAPTRLNPDTLQDEPDIDLPLRGEPGQAAVALLLDPENKHRMPALARLHRPGAANNLGDGLRTAVMNAGALPDNGDAPMPASPGALVHTAGVSKAAGTMLSALTMNMPVFARELDPVDDALNVPHEVADFGGASFWVGMARAIERVNEQGEPALCVDCQSLNQMLPLVLNPPIGEGENV